MFDRILILVCSQKYLGARYLMTMEIDELIEENTMPTNLVSKINRQFQDLIILQLYTIRTKKSHIYFHLFTFTANYFSS